MTIRKWGGETLVNATSPTDQTAPVVAALKDGGYVIAWVDDMGAGDSVIKFQMFTAGGVKSGTEKTVPVSDGAGDQDQPTIGLTSTGNFIIGVRDFDSTGDHDTMAYEFTGTGANQGQLVRTIILDELGSRDSGAPVVTLSQGIDNLSNPTAFAYRNSIGEVRVQALNADGTENQPAKVAITANGGGPLDFASSPLAQVAMMVAPNDNGVSRGLIFQSISPQFDPASASLFQSTIRPVVEVDIEASPNSNLASYVCVFEELGRNFNNLISFFGVGGSAGFGLTARVNVDRGHHPTVHALKDGQFVISYLSADITPELRMQLFDTNGVKVGQTIVVNTNGMNILADAEPSIDLLADGRLIVTWNETSGVGGNGLGVFQQILDPREGFVNGSSDPLLAETLYGNDSTNDQINGFAGNDTIYGLAGADTIYGGDGDDSIYGGRGDDTVRGGNNTDRLYGDLGDDEQYGEAGSDIIYSGRGADLMDGGAGIGSDTAYYSSEKIGAVINLLDQTLNAGSADGDTLLSFESIFGSNTAADTITGGNGNETILGNGGDDILNGSGGSDTLRGGVGADTLNGGTGADKFQYTALNEVGDVIITYEAVDDFQFARAAFGNLAGANVAAVNFLSVASGHAAITVNQLFIFDQALDQLWYDADGSNAGAAVMVADLSNNINVTNLDLLLF
jgi:Ca2+-binding RTX toxin-like protein